jgi:hypothetical protein
VATAAMNACMENFATVAVTGLAVCCTRSDHVIGYRMAVTASCTWNAWQSVNASRREVCAAPYCMAGRSLHIGYGSR